MGRRDCKGRGRRSKALLVPLCRAEHPPAEPVQEPRASQERLRVVPGCSGAVINHGQRSFLPFLPSLAGLSGILGSWPQCHQIPLVPCDWSHASKSLCQISASISLCPASSSVQLLTSLITTKHIYSPSSPAVGSKDEIPECSSPHVLHLLMTGLPIVHTMGQGVDLCHPK